MKRVLITGVGGFIGAHVARRFVGNGYEVVGVDDFSSGFIRNVPAGVELVELDLAHRDAVARLPGGCQLILHLAGQSSGEISFDNPVADLKKNTVSTLNLIRYGMDNGARRIVYASSMSVYGAVPDGPISEARIPSPLSCYGVGKLAAEGYLHVYRTRLPFVAMRMFNVYGPGQDLGNLRQGMVSIYLAQALARGSIEVKGSTERFRDFIYIDDVVEAWWRAATAVGTENRILNLGTGCRTTVGELLTAVCDQVPGSTYYCNGTTPGDQTGIYADVTEIGAALGLREFVPLSRGLPLFAAWARAQADNQELPSRS
jgi:UDP-glucose 4-epimerase